MDYTEAYNRLDKAGLTVSVSMRNDSPVELLFFDEGIRQWNSWCLIDENGNIPEDARETIEELY